MLTLHDPSPAHDCQGYSRREFLRIGGLALGGITLSSLLSLRAKGSVDLASVVRDRSVVLLFLQGGPPHIEFFDPKMSAPVDVRSITGEIKTALPGVTFGSTFPKLAAMADKLAVVRSYASNNADHTYAGVASGNNKLKATMGALYARIAGATHPASGMPRNTLILPEAVSPGLKLGANFESGALVTLTDAGALGRSYAAFNPAGGGALFDDMQLQITPGRLDDRRGLLKQLDGVRRRIDSTGVMDAADTYQQQAFGVITGAVSKAFDLSREDPATIEKYDTSKLFDVAKLNVWNDMRRTSNQLGRQMLLARRLCEAGCGFVTVSDCGWDYHANGNSPKRMAGIYPMGGQVDHAVSTFIQDLHDRGLSEKILLVVTGEMGRTPRLNKDGGRDHYGKLTTLMLAGGGMKMGQVIGESDRFAAEPATTPYGPENLLATVMHSLFDVGRVRTATGISNDVAEAITSGSPIRELV